jgi:hypothetical protein
MGNMDDCEDEMEMREKGVRSVRDGEKNAS